MGFDDTDYLLTEEDTQVTEEETCSNGSTSVDNNTEEDFEYYGIFEDMELKGSKLK